LCLVVLAASLSGCDDKRRHLTSEAIEFTAMTQPVPQDAEPAVVVRAFLAALRDAQHARGRDFQGPQDRATYDSAMGRIASLAAGRTIYERILGSGSRSVPAGLTPEAAVTTISESWVSIVAYYVDGFMLETLNVTPARGTTSPTTLRAYLEAQRPEDRSRLTQIERSDEVIQARDPEGLPLVKGSPPYVELVRSRSLEMRPAFNVPIRVRLDISLQTEDGAWRVSDLHLRPAPATRPAKTPTPTTS
jgi:hypothetical protein